jgi:hypothetical protein
MSTKPTLLAASDTLDQITAAIERFYCGSPKRLEPTGPARWCLVSPATGKHLAGVFVEMSRGRYRFMMEA